MPVEEIIGAVNSGINTGLQALTNVTNRKFAREQYKTQRRDALTDWEMQNAYNSPKQQMARFKEAGLNPHLMYGQGSDVSPVRSSSPSGGQATAPKSDLGQMYSYALKSNQSDLTQENRQFLKAREENVKADTVKKLADVDLTKQNVDRGSIKLAIERNLQDVAIAKAGWEADYTREKYNEQYWKAFFAEQVEKKKLDVLDQSIKNSEKFRELSDSRKDEILQRIDLMKKEGALKDFETSLGKPAQIGIQILRLIFGK